MAKHKQASAQDNTLIESPEVHMDRRGRLYVNVYDLYNSKGFKDQLNELDEIKKLFPKSRSDTRKGDKTTASKRARTDNEAFDPDLSINVHDRLQDLEDAYAALVDTVLNAYPHYDDRPSIEKHIKMIDEIHEKACQGLVQTYLRNSLKTPEEMVDAVFEDGKADAERIPGLEDSRAVHIYLINRSELAADEKTEMIDRLNNSLYKRLLQRANAPRQGGNTRKLLQANGWLEKPIKGGEWPVKANVSPHAKQSIRP